MSCTRPVELLDDVEFHWLFLSRVGKKRPTPVDSEPRFGGELKAIRDKKRIFIEKKCAGTRENQGENVGDFPEDLA
jgi:hypothetical protein